MLNVLSICLFGMTGVLCRYGVDLTIARLGAHLTLGTLAVNAVGSFLAGTLYALAATKELSPLQIGLMVGFCGGFTTFSAYTLQTLMMLERGKIFPGFLYLFGSPLVGVVAALIPLLLFKSLSPHG